MKSNYKESEVLWPNARGRADRSVSGKDVSPDLAANFNGKDGKIAQCSGHVEEMNERSIDV